MIDVKAAMQKLRYDVTNLLSTAPLNESVDRTALLALLVAIVGELIAVLNLHAVSCVT